MMKIEERQQGETEQSQISKIKTNIPTNKQTTHRQQGKTEKNK